MSVPTIPEGEQDSLAPVRLPSGGKYFIFEEETTWWDERVRKYGLDLKFDNVSDLQDLDRIMISELLVWRWGIYLSRGTDYNDSPVVPGELQKALREYVREIRLAKSALGMDRVTREKQRGEESIPNYLDNLRRRAKQFGIHRNNQFAKIMELFNDIIAIITLHGNCDEQERIELDCRAEDVIAKIRDDIIPQYQELDEDFRNKGDDAQKMWIRDL